jgi:hypothetical protein
LAYLPYGPSATGGRFGKIGAAIALPGLLSYLVGQLLQVILGLAATDIGIFYAMGAPLVCLGMLPLGIAALWDHRHRARLYWPRA